jgi:hypothetical protein
VSGSEVVQRLGEIAQENELLSSILPGEQTDQQPWSSRWHCPSDGICCALERAITHIPDHRKRVEEYLATPHWFKHRFTPRRQEEALRSIQEGVDVYGTAVEQ